MVSRWSRRLGCIGSLLVLTALEAHAETPEEIFGRANTAYEQGRFDDAAAAYRRLIEYRIRDPRVEFNLGNAEFKRGRLGSAVLHWERARRMDPLDPDIATNLTLARTFLADRVEPREQSGVLRFVAQLQDRIGPDRQAWFGLLLVWAAAALLAYGLGRPGRFGPLHGWILAALLLVGAATYGSWWSTWQRVEGQRLAVVLAESVEVLAGPGVNNATLFTIHEGLTVELRGEGREDWIQISLPNGLNGWVPLGAVGIVG